MHLFSASHLLCIPAVSVSHKSILFAFEHNEIKVGVLFETVVTECTENLNTSSPFMFLGLVCTISKSNPQEKKQDEV